MGNLYIIIYFVLLSNYMIDDLNNYDCNHFITFNYYCTALPLEMKYLKLIKWQSLDGALQKYRLVERVSLKWRQFGLRISLTQNRMDGWFAESRDVERCWEKVMQTWLDGQGQREYPPTWEGLYGLLRDVQKEGVVPALREAVDKAVLPGTLYLYSNVCNC